MYDGRAAAAAKQSFAGLLPHLTPLRLGTPRHASARLGRHVSCSLYRVPSRKSEPGPPARKRNEIHAEEAADQCARKSKRMTNNKLQSMHKSARFPPPTFFFCRAPHLKALYAHTHTQRGDRYCLKCPAVNFWQDGPECTSCSHDFINHLLVLFGSRVAAASAPPHSVLEGLKFGVAGETPTLSGNVSRKGYMRMVAVQLLN